MPVALARFGGQRIQYAPLGLPPSQAVQPRKAARDLVRVTKGLRRFPQAPRPVRCKAQAHRSTIEAGATRLPIEQPFVGVAPLAPFGYGYAQPVIQRDCLRHPVNSNVGRLRKSHQEPELKARKAANPSMLAGPKAGELIHDARLNGGMKNPNARLPRSAVARKAARSESRNECPARAAVRATMPRSGSLATAAIQQPGLLAPDPSCRPTRHSSGLASPSAEFQR